MTTQEKPPPCSQESGATGMAMRSLDRDSLNIKSLGSGSPNKEWDLCVRKGTLTVGVGMVAGMFLGMLMGGGIPLAWGTGAGVLWSIKRCRALMRDGIITPEQARLKKEEKTRERLEKKRQLEEERKKRKITMKTEPSYKSARALEAMEDTHECCKKLQKLLEQQKQKQDDVKTVENEQEKRSTNKSITEPNAGCPLNDSNKMATSVLDESAVSKSKFNFNSTTTVKLFVPESPAFRTRVSANGTDICICSEGDNGDMKRCSSCSFLQSNENQVDKPTQLSTLNESAEERSGDIDDKLIYPSVQENADDTKDESSVEINLNFQDEGEENRKNPSDLLILQNITMMNEETDASDMKGQHEEDRNSIIIYDEQQEQAMEEDVEEVIEINGDSLNLIIHEVDENECECGDEEYCSNESELSSPEIEESIVQELNNLDEKSIEDIYGKEEVIFVETYKSESWPFSFPIPSLEKFHTKSTDSTFKWPPLPSSIIVRPRKEPSCTCSEQNPGQADAVEK